MIDRKTGCVTLSATCQVRAGDDLADLVSLSLGEVQEVVDLKNGWTWLTIKNLPANEKTYAIISLGFHANALKQIELVVAEDRFNLTATWDSWSEQNELHILKKLRRWLINEVGRDGTFNWGTVQAIYDPKSGSSSINIQYM